jgi:hypothetical protein
MAGVFEDGEGRCEVAGNGEFGGEIGFYAFSKGRAARGVFDGEVA